MDGRLLTLADRASNHHGVVSLDDIQQVGVSRQLLARWAKRGQLRWFGHRSFTLPGTPVTWRTRLAGALAGRADGALLRLDGFSEGPVEVLVPRSARSRSSANAVIRSTSRPLLPNDIVTIDGLRCLSAERLILEAPLFGFDHLETANAIDSAIRMRLVAEARLRRRVADECSTGVNGSRTLRAALVDTGCESALERRFLALLRRDGLPRPELQLVYRDGTRTVARVDAHFPPDLVVELAGHGTHSTRRQRQIDAQRHTELTLRGLRVLTFTYDDVTHRPEWVVTQLRLALSRHVA